MDLRQDYVRRINRVIDHIQAHLGEDLTVEGLAAVACFSPYHFHRVFRAMVGEPLYGFVRRLRLEKAANLLRVAPRKSVTEIALDCGFQSTAGFARAFRDQFGTSASNYRKIGNTDRKNGNAPDAAPPYAVLEPPPDVRQESEEEAMDVRLETYPESTVAYVRRIGPYDESAGQAWEALCRWAGPRGLLTEEGLRIGLGHDDPSVTDPERCRYDACIPIPEDLEVDGDVSRAVLPGGRYAVLRYEGPGEGIKEAWHQLYADWMPRSGYEPDHRPCYEIYRNDPGREGRFVMDICVPVKPA